MVAREHSRTGLTGGSLESCDHERLGSGAARLLYLNLLDRPAVAFLTLETIYQHAFVLLDVRRCHLVETAHLHGAHCSRIGGRQA